MSIFSLQIKKQLVWFFALFIFMLLPEIGLALWPLEFSNSEGILFFAAVLAIPFIVVLFLCLCLHLLIKIFFPKQTKLLSAIKLISLLIFIFMVVYIVSMVL